MKTRGQIWRNLIKNWLKELFSNIMFFISILVIPIILMVPGYLISMIFVRNFEINLLFGFLPPFILCVVSGVSDSIKKIKEAYDREKNR